MISSLERALREIEHTKLQTRARYLQNRSIYDPEKQSEQKNTSGQRRFRRQTEQFMKDLELSESFAPIEYDE
jgi:hypothetical protein